MSAFKSVIVPIHPAGYPFIAAFAAATFFLTLLSGSLGWIGFILTVWCIYFFRNPIRTVPEDDNLILSPADGTVLKVHEAKPPAELDLGNEPMTKISIFLNVFDVHVNRIPCSGTITKAVYHPGKFLNASLDKASEDNERMSLKIRTQHSVDIGCVQIAGLVARRIICEVDENDAVKAGAQYGIIRFGSRADIYLPRSVNTLVLPGQKMIGGESILAEFKKTQPTRTGYKC